MKPLHDIFSPPGPCPDSETLKKAVEGKLEDAKQHALESHLLDCEACSEALEGLKSTPNAMDQLPVLAERFEAMRNTPAIGKKTIPPWSLMMRAAAVLLPLMVAMTWWFWPKATAPSLATNDGIPYEKFSGGLDLIPTFRSGGHVPNTNDPKALLRQAILAYERDAWDTARTLFTQWQVQDTQSVISPLFLGLIDLEQNQTASAVAYLEQVHQSGLLPEISSWYLSQAYWRNGQPGKARPLLDYLIQRKSVYAPKATQLLSILSVETKDR